MKKEIRQNIVEFEVFVSDDGKEFNTAEEAIFNDRLVSGEINICPVCGGMKYVKKMYNSIPVHVTCDHCKGYGYIANQGV